jgi:hypothetical protein
MANVLKEAVQKAEKLPTPDQEQIGRNVLSYIERLQQLRTEIDKGIASLKTGKGQTFNIKAFIQKRYEKA